MKNSLETRLGIFVALTLIALFIILQMIGGLNFFKPGYQVDALFNTAQELQEGDGVKMGGVEIGKVKKITIVTNLNKVRVTMKLNKEASVKTDSMATIKFAGLMGQYFVSIDFGTPGAPVIDNGMTINSAEQADFGQIMQKLDNVASGIENVTKSFSGDKIDNLLGPFTDFLKANKDSLTASIANLKTISDQISRGEGTVGKLIFNDSLYNSSLATVSNLQVTADEIKLTISDAHKIVDQINSGEGTVGRLVKDDSLWRETTNSMTNLKEILQKINTGQGSIGKLVNDQEFYKNAKLTLQKLDKVTEGMEDQGPLSVLGIAVNSLF